MRQPEVHQSEVRQPKAEAAALKAMPRLYFERTTPEEQKRHEKALRLLEAGGEPILEAIEEPNGDWLFEIVMQDWEEPGLLDRIFEAILRCYRLEEGISMRRARIFTGAGGQVVNLLELRNRTGQKLSQASAGEVLERLREIRPGERGALETIQNISFGSLIPLIPEIPISDNKTSRQFTRIEFRVERISNRFTSVLLHFLARSELWLNIQVAEFEQNETGTYVFYVVDKRGRKLKDSSFLRQNMVWALEAMNAMLIRFNVHYLRREWQTRIENNRHTIYHSRPDFADFLADMDNVRAMARLKGFDGRLSPLVEEGLLDSQSYFFLKKTEAFVRQYQERAHSIAAEGPAEEDVELCREYFDLRRRALGIIEPLFESLEAMPTLRPLLSPRMRLQALSMPLPQQQYALDERNQLFLDGPIWLGEPIAALDPFLMVARTGCFLHPELENTIKASLEGWNEIYIRENREQLGARFLAILDESIRQSNTSIVLRNLRLAGLLERYIPGFREIQGRIHVDADHAYTVDEHSFAVIEVIQGLKLLQESMLVYGKSLIREDYEKIRDAAGLKNFARKYAMELRMLHQVTPLRGHPSVRPFFNLMEEARRNNLEYLIEVNLLEFGYDTCMAALSEIEEIRNQLSSFIHFYQHLSFEEQRLLTLAGLFHDLKKPAQDHGERGAVMLDAVLEGMGLRLPAGTVDSLRWLIRHHLDIRPLIHRMGAGGDDVLEQYTRDTGDAKLVKMLILFTYADRVAIRPNLNANAHAAMVLGEMLGQVERIDSGQAPPPPG